MIKKIIKQDRKASISLYDEFLYLDTATEDELTIQDVREFFKEILTKLSWWESAVIQEGWKQVIKLKLGHGNHYSDPNLIEGFEILHILEEDEQENSDRLAKEAEGLRTKKIKFHESQIIALKAEGLKLSKETKCLQN